MSTSLLPNLSSGIDLSQRLQQTEGVLHRDQSWFQPSRDATLATPLKRGMGNLRLIALASHILDQVIKIKTSLNAEPGLQLDAITELYRTISVLKNVFKEEAQE